jgi:hypothetical protein
MAITSFNFFLYFSFSFKAFSRSLLRPKIMALCLSTSRHNCEFCCDWDCFSFTRYWMTASALPAALIRLETSGIDAGDASGDDLFGTDREDIADMAESIDEFLGALFVGSAREAAEGPAMVGRAFEELPPSGVLVTTESDRLRLSFGIRGDRAGLSVWSAMPNLAPNVECPVSTHSGLAGSGLSAPEESLS